MPLPQRCLAGPASPPPRETRNPVEPPGSSAWPAWGVACRHCLHRSADVVHLLCAGLSCLADGEATAWPVTFESG